MWVCFVLSVFNDSSKQNRFWRGTTRSKIQDMFWILLWEPIVDIVAIDLPGVALLMDEMN